MNDADDDATTPNLSRSSDLIERFLPFPAEALELPDLELMSTFWHGWLTFSAARRGIPATSITPEVQEAVRLATLGLDTDNQAMAALEKILRRIAGYTPGAEIKIAEMIRAHFRGNALHVAALEEAVTGRRRQRANGRKARTDALQVIVMECLKKSPLISLEGLLGQLSRYPRGGTIEQVDDFEQVVDWYDGNHRCASTPFSGLKHRLSRARKKVASL